jgi:peptidoglycan-associated lipoprotein
MKASDGLNVRALCRASATGGNGPYPRRRWRSPDIGRSGAQLLAAALLVVPMADSAPAQLSGGPRPPITKLATPDTDADTTRQEAANERIAAFLIAEAREELELGELRSARSRLEILVTRFAGTAVAPRARRMLEQLAVIDGYPIPPLPKGAPAIETTRATHVGSESLTARPPGASLLEADFSASGGDRLFFAEGSDDIGGRGLRILREKAAWLKRHGKVFVRIEGHADDHGGDDINAALALRRAETVRDALAQAGVPATRMHIAAFGRESRISTCSGPGCAAQNRRAVLVLTDERGARLSRETQQAASAGVVSGPDQGLGQAGPARHRDR